jgi:hypothetical protein
MVRGHLERAQQPGRIKRTAVVDPILRPEAMNENSEQPYYPRLFAELRRLGQGEGKNLIVVHPGA